MKEEKEKIRQEAKEKLQALQGVAGGNGSAPIAQPKPTKSRRNKSAAQRSAANPISKYKIPEDSRKRRERGKVDKVEANGGGNSAQTSSGNRNSKRKSEEENDERKHADENLRRTFGGKRPKPSVLAEVN